MQDVKAARIQVDEIWSFTYAKQKNVATAKSAPEGAGDTWTWTAIDPDTKLIVSYLIDGRDSEYAMEFMDDLASRLTPAMAAGVTDRLSEIADIAKLVDAAEAKPGKRGPFKMKAA